MASIAPYSVARPHNELVVSSAIYGLVQSAEGLLKAVDSTLRLWMKRAAVRREIAGLSDAVLHDIGLTRYEAQLEAEKPFWVK